MGDYIRAAMTCVRFYTENVNNFTDLVNNIHFLAKAEEHLRHGIEQEQWIELAPGMFILVLKNIVLRATELLLLYVKSENSYI